MDAKFNVTMNEYLPLRDVVFNTLRQAIPVSYTHLDVYKRQLQR